MSEQVDKRALGIYHKFDVTRTDGQSAPGGKHDKCEYFVLDLTHDPYALSAVRAYATACKKEYPVLSKELETKISLIMEKRRL